MRKGYMPKGRKIMKLAVLFGTRDLIVYECGSEKFNLNRLNPTSVHRRSDGCLIRLSACNATKESLYETQRRLQDSVERVLVEKGHSQICLISEKAFSEFCKTL